MEPLQDYLTKEGWKRDLGKTLDHLGGILFRILPKEQPVYEPIHRTQLERQYEQSDIVRRELIQNGMEPSFADYEARRRVGLTR